MTTLERRQVTGNMAREELLTMAVVRGWAAMVLQRSVELKIGPAVLAVLGTEDDECDRLRQAMVDDGTTTFEKIEKLHQRQRAEGMPAHNAVLWPESMLVRKGPELLPPDELALVLRRLPDPGWQVIVALGGGGATALCLPAAVVDAFAGELAADAPAPKPGGDAEKVSDE